MKELFLPKIGETARIGVLNSADIDSVIELHETTRAALPVDRKRYILPQPSIYFENLLNRKTGLMLGLRAKDKLVAQMALMGPMPLRQAIFDQVITHNEVPFHHASLSDPVIVLKSLASHPDWRGNDLAKNLVAFAIEYPFAQVCAHLFAQVSVGNKRSWDAFMRNKFGIVAAAYDPDDGLPRFIFQRPTFGFDLEPAIMADEVDPLADFPAIVSLTQREALIGVYGEDSAEKLIFFRSREEEMSLIQTIARAS